jgi:hypothetical protein
MRLILCAAYIVLLVTVGAVAQTGNEAAGVLARLSYRSGSTVVDWHDQKGYPRICMAVYRTGYYQVSRLTEFGYETLQGTLPKASLDRLRELLKNVNFKSAGNGIQYLQGTESVIVERDDHGHTTHYFWINPDNQNPLPKSATRLVNWLESFRTRGATPFEHFETSDIRICPSMNDNPLPLISMFKEGASCHQR